MEPVLIQDFWRSPLQFLKCHVKDGTTSMKLLASLNVSLVFAGTIAFAFGILPVAARGQTSQEVRLEVSQLLFGSGPTFLNSTANGDINLSVGVTGLESQANIATIPAGLPVAGVGGTLFVQTNSFDAPSSSATAFYEFEFALPAGAEDLFLLYIPQNFANQLGDAAGSSLQLTRDQTVIFSGEDEPFVIEDGFLAPGDYVLTLEAEASVTDDNFQSFASAQPQFQLSFTPVPEPTSAGLAGFTFVALGSGP